MLMFFNYRIRSAYNHQSPVAFTSVNNIKCKVKKSKAKSSEVKQTLLLWCGLVERYPIWGPARERAGVLDSQAPVHKYPDNFWKRRFSPPFSKKSTRIPHRVCVMLLVYDERHRRIRKPPFSAFSKISTLKSVFEKMRFPCGRYVKPLKKKSPFSNKKGHVWTGPSCLSVKIWVIS